MSFLKNKTIDSKLLIKIQDDKKGKVNVLTPGEKSEIIDTKHPFAIASMDISTFESGSEKSFNSMKAIHASKAIFLSCTATEDSDLEVNMNGFSSKRPGSPTIIFDVSGISDEKYAKITFLWPESIQKISLKKNDTLNIIGIGFTFNPKHLNFQKNIR